MSGNLDRALEGSPAKVAKAGDTMTGSLEITDNNSVYLSDSSDFKATEFRFTGTVTTLGAYDSGGVFAGTVLSFFRGSQDLSIYGSTTVAKAITSDLPATIDNHLIRKGEAAVLAEAQTFTEAQRTSTTAGDNSIAFNDDNNHTLTATATNITVTNQTIGQSGTIRITTAENVTGWGTEFDWGNAGVPSSLTAIETFAYYISGASGADSIQIGRL